MKEFALVSAFDDDRFEPIQRQELEGLHVSLSLLVKFSKKPLDDPLNWKIGKHGLTLEIMDRNGELCESTFLPEVAKEEKWSKWQTLEELLEKAEYEEDDLEDVLDRIKVSTYESIVCKLSYKEYVALRKK